MLRSMIPWERRLSRFPKFEDEMESLVERLMGNGEEWGISQFTPSVNVAETEDAYEVSAELPGMEPDDVHVEFKEGVLWITGEKQEEKEEKGKTHHRIERRYGQFRRSIPFPGAVKESDVQAHFKNGVLVVMVPKTEEVKPRRIPVKH